MARRRREALRYFMVCRVAATGVFSYERVIFCRFYTPGLSNCSCVGCEHSTNHTSMSMLMGVVFLPSCCNLYICLRLFSGFQCQRIKPAFGIQCSHTTCTSRSNSLTVNAIHDITGCKYTRDRRLSCITLAARLYFDIAVF